MSSARVQQFAFGCIWAAAILTMGVLALIIGLIVWRGLPSISWEFLTGSPENLGRDGGILPTIIGTMVLGLVALLIATPLGIGSAIYLTEYTYESRFTRPFASAPNCWPACRPLFSGCSAISFS